MPTVKELKEQCKRQGVGGYSRLNKSDLEQLCAGKKQPRAKSIKRTTVKELKKQCKRKGIEGYSRLTKADLEKLCAGKKQALVKKSVPISEISGIGLNSDSDIVNFYDFLHSAGYKVPYSDQPKSLLKSIAAMWRSEGSPEIPSRELIRTVVKMKKTSK